MHSSNGSANLKGIWPIAAADGLTFDLISTSSMPARRSFLLTLLLASQQVNAAKPSLPSQLPALLDKLGFGPVETATRTTPSGDASVTTITADPQGNRSGVQLVWAEIKHARPKMDVRSVLKFGSSYDILSNETPPGVCAVINGGFFGYDAKGMRMPLGLVVSKGQMQNGRMAWRGGGILYQDKAGQLHVVSPSALANLSSVVSAIQSKPVLVEKAKLAINSDNGDRFNRSAVLLNNSGGVIIVGVFQSFGRAMAMKEFAQVVATIRFSSGSAGQVAIAMDGGPGAQLYIPELKLHFGDSGKNFVPNLVQFSR